MPRRSESLARIPYLPGGAHIRSLLGSKSYVGDLNSLIEPYRLYMWTRPSLIPSQKLPAAHGR